MIKFFVYENFIYFCAWVSHTRPAPSKFPQGRKAARVGGCSGAMYSAYPFFVYGIRSFCIHIGSPLKIRVYINCIFAEAWPSAIFLSDGHAVFRFVIDYQAVVFRKVFPSAIFPSDGHAVFCFVTDYQAVVFWKVFPSAIFLSDGHAVFCFVTDYQVVVFWKVCPSALFPSDGHGVRREGTTLRKVSLLFSHPYFIPTKKNI